MLSVLIEGTLTTAPVSRTSTKGRPYTTARVRASGEGGETIWCNVIAFNADAAEALADLANGDSVAIAGHATLATWDKDGEQRVGLRVKASRVLSVYEAGKRRGAASSQPREAAA